jgi:hypothetical protein
LSIGAKIGYGGGTVLLLILGMIFAFLVLKRRGVSVLGKTIQAGIERYDQHYLGVNVNIGKLEVDAAHGNINVEEVLVENPPGYHSPHFVTIKKVTLDLDMGKTLSSLGRKIVIDEATLSGVDLIYEKSFTTSNINDILVHLQGDHPAQKEQSEDNRFLSCCSSGKKPPSTGQKVDDKENKGGYINLPTADAKQTSPNPKPHEQDQTEVVMKKLQLVDIGVKLASYAARGMGQYTSLADICLDDVEDQKKKISGDKAAGVAMILAIVLNSVKKSVVANVMGKSFADQRY